MGFYQDKGSLIAKELPKHGNRRWEITTSPATEPVTTDELKTFARIDGSDEDTMLEGFIQTVRKATENYLGRGLIEQTITLKMDWWPGIQVELPQPPLIAITRIATLDEDDTETTYSSDNYYIITEGSPGLLVIKNGIAIPTNTTRYTGGFLIVYTVGYGDAASDVPELIKTGIMLWASELYETRKFDSKLPPPAAKVVLDTYKIRKI